MTQQVLIDACVLFPPLVRAIVIEIAKAGIVTPLWSERIFDEWRIAVVRKHGIDVEAEVVASQNALALEFREACVQVDPALEEQITLPDAADAHVLAAAVTGNADVLLTFNLKDFPKATAAQYGIEIAHPDGFLWRLLSEAPQGVQKATLQTFDAAEVPASRQRSVLKRARLSRFGKALEAMDPL